MEHDLSRSIYGPGRIGKHPERVGSVGERNGSGGNSFTAKGQSEFRFLC
jgi:hypothetical protein